MRETLLLSDEMNRQMEELCRFFFFKRRIVTVKVMNSCEELKPRL